jgi:alginate O-acetyltransferase complex protein AlgJ
MSRVRNISFVVAFVLVLLAPSVASLCHWNPMGRLDEKRVLAPKPTERLWPWGKLARVPAFTQAWEKYFNDNFGLRKLLLGSYRLAVFCLLRTSPNPAVVVGKSDGERRWLYFDASKMPDGVGFESILGRIPYTPAQLAAMAAQLRRVTDLVRSRGIGLAIVVCPDKQTMYPEYLPRDKVPPPGAISRLDQFWAMAARLDGVPLVDMRIPLKVEKPSMQLYYPSDTHWNYRAGALAYKAIGDLLATQDPEWRSLPTEKLQWQLGPPHEEDLILLMGVPPIGVDRNWLPLLPTLADGRRPKRGKVVVVGDSFSDGITPYLEVQFASVKHIPGALHILAHVTPVLLDAEKPDVVIIESVERYWTSN